MSQDQSPATGTPIERERDLIAAARRQATPREGSSRAPIGVPLPDAFPGYEIVREIHRGGQGVVYQAIQKATKRKVAIKVMREGPFAGPRDKARFEREVEILAQLEHPNIVGVLDSGEASGSYFLVMDYISGRSLDGFISESGPTIDDALTLFAKICDAVNAAHLRGVIHRDLKPSNIRVDSSGEPHILDFGLAKIATGDVSGESHPHMMTMTGQFVGSLPWASPEQAAGAVGEIDIRTDVYSLGVVLYQMLTGGRFPYRVIGNMREVLDNIMKAEPARPSTIRRQINDEVETIVLKSLSKERERRYQSAGELARDVRRYLDGLPIEAKRDSGWYLLGKAVKRYRLPAGIAAGFVVLLALFGGAMTLLYQQAARAELQALAGFAAAVEAKDQEAEARAKAEANFQAARTMARTFLFDFHDRIEHLKGATPARELILTKGLEYLKAVQAQSPDDPALLRELAEGYDRVGDIQGGLHMPRVGTTPEAATSYAEARRIREALVARSPNDALALADLAESKSKSADLLRTGRKRDEAAAEYDAALATAEQARGMARVDDAETSERAGRVAQRAHFRRAGLRRDGIADAPDDAGARVIAASALEDYAAAEQLARGRLGADPDDRPAAEMLASIADNRVAVAVALASRLRATGNQRRDAGDAPGAIEFYDRAAETIAGAVPGAAAAVEDFRQLSERRPESAPARRGLMLALHTLGDARMRQGDALEAGRDAAPEADRPAREERMTRAYEASREAFAEAHAIAQAMASTDESNLQAQRDLAVCLNKMCHGAANLGRMDEAGEWADQSIQARRELWRTDPTPMHRRDLCVSLFRRAEINVIRARDADAALKRSLLSEAERLLAESMGHLEVLRADALIEASAAIYRNTARDLAKVRGELGKMEPEAAPP